MWILFNNVGIGNCNWYKNCNDDLGVIVINFGDLHCDTITKIFESESNIYENFAQVDIKKLSIYDEVIQFFAIWLKQKYLDHPFENTKMFIKYYDEQIKIYKEYFPQMKFFLAIEGGEALENNLANLEKFYQMGAVLLTLTWNNENDLAGGANSSCGLKKFGFEVVEHMNQLNMIVDVSHASKKTFWDVYKFSSKPFIASHSNCQKICEHVRNLDDDQILAIKEGNGLIGLNLYTPFIKKASSINLHDLNEHVEHLLNLIGSDNICWGCDFDGADDYPLGIKNVVDMKKVYNLFEKLYDKDITDKIFYGNLKKFLCRNQIL